MKMIKSILIAAALLAAPAFAQEMITTFPDTRSVALILSPLGDQGFQIMTLEEFRLWNTQFPNATLETEIPAGTPIVFNRDEITS